MQELCMILFVPCAFICVLYAAFFLLSWVTDRKSNHEKEIKRNRETRRESKIENRIDWRNFAA